MARYRAPAVAFCMWLAASGVSAAADHPKCEAWLGAGGGKGFEESALNAATDVASNPVRAGRDFMLSAEGIGSFRVAIWERDHPNSADRKFTPSTQYELLSPGLAWGWERTAAPAPAASGVHDTSLAAAGETDSAGVRANGSSVAAPSTGQRISAGQLVLFEGLIALLSAPAYADDKGGALAGVTAGSALLGMAAGNSSSGSANKIMFFGLLSLAALEIGLGQAGATEDALFATSLVGWNGIGYFATRAEQKEKARR